MADLKHILEKMAYTATRLAYTPASRSKTGCASSTKGLAPPALCRKKQPPKTVSKNVLKAVPKSALQSPRSSLTVSAEPLARARQLTLRLQPPEGPPAAVRRQQHHRQTYSTTPYSYNQVQHPALQCHKPDDRDEMYITSFVSGLSR